MSLNESLSGEERDKFEVFEYPVSDKYTNMWTFMKQSQLPETGDEAIDRVLNSEEEFAFIGKTKNKPK
jgi:ionotropic glutamate receptor